MGSDSASRTIIRKCTEFRDVLQERDFEKALGFLSEEFRASHSAEIESQKLFVQKPRLLTKIFVGESYRPKDLILLKEARFRAMKAKDGGLSCKVLHNGENQDPELATLREIQWEEQGGDWKIVSWNIHGSW